MNDITIVIEHSTPSLFVDDLSLITHAKRPSALCRKIQTDLDKIEKWSYLNQMIFAPTKFHIIYISPDNKKLTKKHKDSITYDNKQLHWSRAEKLLGVTFDSKLNFLPHLHDTIQSVKTSRHLIWPHCDRASGSNTSTLLDIFDSFIKPKMLYGSPLWIFQAYPKIRFDAKPERPYGEPLKKLHQLYNYLLSLCAGTKQGTSYTAILVRLGRLPLHYLIGFYAMKNFHSITHNYTCPEMKRLLTHSMFDTKRWDNTIFKRALDNISYFSTYTGDGNLLNIPSKSIFHHKLQNAMFKELTTYWSNTNEARSTFQIIPNWQPQTFNRNNTRAHESFYIRLCFTQNDTRTARKITNNQIDPTCQRCKTHPETPQHLLLDCKSLCTERNKMLNQIKTHSPNIQPTLQNILTSSSLQPFVLSFIKRI